MASLKKGVVFARWEVNWPEINNRSRGTIPLTVGVAALSCHRTSKLVKIFIIREWNEKTDCWNDQINRSSHLCKFEMSVWKTWSDLWYRSVILNCLHYLVLFFWYISTELTHSRDVLKCISYKSIYNIVNKIIRYSLHLRSFTQSQSMHSGFVFQANWKISCRADSTINHNIPSNRFKFNYLIRIAFCFSFFENFYTTWFNIAGIFIDFDWCGDFWFSNAFVLWFQLSGSWLLVIASNWRIVLW